MDLREPNLYVIRCIIILDGEGNRVYSKYYDHYRFPSAIHQKKFEKLLYTKTPKDDLDVLVLQGLTCIFKHVSDLVIYVVGDLDVNVFMLSAVMECLHETLNKLFRKNVHKKAVLRHYEMLMLVVDELCDGGIILETNSCEVLKRVALRQESTTYDQATMSQKLLAETIRLLG